mgnify:CR=1 FL=1
MNESPFHPQKPTLIEHVSDDARELRKSNGEQQKTLFSARALADLLAGDTILQSNVSDAGYYVEVSAGVDKIALNRVVDSSIRHLDAGSYVDTVENNTVKQTIVQYSGFLHTMAILPSGVLTYLPPNEECDDPKAVRTYSSMRVRQILYPDDLRDSEAYTRVGQFENNVWTWSRWVPLSGNMLRILVNDSNKSILTSDLRPGVIYELHCSGGTIILPNADTLTAGTKIAFEQYPNKKNLFERAPAAPVPSDKLRYFIKPDPNVERYVPAGNKGWITEFEAGVVYYIQSAVSAWISTAQYVERVKTEGGDSEPRTYSMQMIPALDTIRTSEGDIDVDAGAWYENSEQAIQYRFEVVDREEPVSYLEDGVEVVSTLTWSLDMDPEAVTKMSDMAELLDAHTDPMLKDIVMYSQRQFTGTGGNYPSDGSDFSKFIPKNNEALVVSRPATMCGYIKFSIQGDQNTDEWYNKLKTGFKISIYKFNDGDEGLKTGTVYTYDKVPASQTKPNSYVPYYVKNPEDGSYQLTNNYGYPEKFGYSVTKDKTRVAGKTYYIIENREYEVYEGELISGKTYYERADYYTRTPNTGTDGIAPAKFRHAMDEESVEHEAVFLSPDNSEFDRGSFWDEHPTFTGYIHADRNDTIMVVVNSSDHVNDMKYVSPIVEFYPDAHESYVLKENVMKDRNLYTFSRLTKQPRPGSLNDTVASAQTVAMAYEKIVSTLQGKGLMFGSNPMGTNRANSLTTSGLYTVNDGFGDLPTSNPSTDVKTQNHSTSAKNAALIVLDSTAYDKSVLLHPGEEDTDAVDRENENQKRITQLFVGRGAGTSVAPKMWIRYGEQPKESTSWSWSKWVVLQAGQSIHTFSGDVTVAQSEEALRYGNPAIVVSGGSTTRRTIKLPDPANYAGTRLQIEAIGCLVRIQYGPDSDPTAYDSQIFKESPDRMLFPVECDGTSWYVVVVN